MPTACLEPQGWNKTHLYSAPQGTKNSPIVDPDQFTLSYQQYWPLAPICVTWHNLPTHRAIEQGRTHIPFRQLGDYPYCNCTVDVGDHPSGESHPEPSCLPQYLTNNKRVHMSLNQVQLTYSAILNAVIHGLPQGVFWICGSWAGRVLPAAWNGSCTLGTLMPAGIQFYPKSQPASALEPPLHLTRRKRAYSEVAGYDPDRTFLTEGQRFASILFPSWGVAVNVRQIRRLSYQLEALANDTADAASALQTEITSISETLVQYKLALDFLLSRAGGLCRWLNQSRCCHLIDLKGRITTDISKNSPSSLRHPSFLFG